MSPTNQDLLIFVANALEQLRKTERDIKRAVAGREPLPVTELRRLWDLLNDLTFAHNHSVADFRRVTERHERRITKLHADLKVAKATIRKLLKKSLTASPAAGSEPAQKKD